MIEEKKRLESRLDKYTKEAAAGKLVKLRRYRMMACSVGVSVVVFAAYSIIFPVKAKEGAIYVNDNQALPLPSETVDLTIQKEEIDQPAVKTNGEIKESLSSKTNEDKTKTANPTASSNKANSKKTSESTVSTTKSKDKQDENDSAKTYPEWNKNKTYQAGDRVMYKEKVYQANKENKNSPPDESHVLFGSSWDEVK